MSRYPTIIEFCTASAIAKPSKSSLKYDFCTAVWAKLRIRFVLFFHLLARGLPMLVELRFRFSVSQLAGFRLVHRMSLKVNARGGIIPLLICVLQDTLSGSSSGRHCNGQGKGCQYRVAGLECGKQKV
jgi:hypothetical protein